MIKVKVSIKHDFIVELPVENFSEIMFENMPRRKSDQLVEDAVSEKYRFVPLEICSVKEIKESDAND